jgi:protein TonB
MNLALAGPRIEHRNFSFPLLLSLGLHILVLLWVGWAVHFSATHPLPSETIVQLVEPPAKPPPSVLFGTRNPEDLEKLPRGKTTRLPPIPRSEHPAPEPSVGPRSPEKGGPPVTASRESAAATSPKVAPSSPHPSVEILPEKAEQPDLSLPPVVSSVPRSSPQPEIPVEPPSVSQETSKGPASPPRGIPGLPFADKERLAKLFSDDVKTKASPKDQISINTQDLKYYSYGLQILNKIETIWRYPEEAGRAGIGGEVVVDMMIGRDGRLADLLLVQSSGYSVLDDEVFRAVRRAAPYAPLPTGLVEDPFPMTIHFLYIAHSHYLYRTR